MGCLYWGLSVLCQADTLLRVSVDGWERQLSTVDTEGLAPVY